MPHGITPYGLFLVAGIAFAWWRARRGARSSGLDSSHVDLALPLILILGGLGARFLAITDPGDAALAAQGFHVHGRLRLFGLIFAGLAVLAVYCRIAKISYPAMADVFAVPAIAGLAILRIGCFLAGCCWGDACADPERLQGVEPESLQTQMQSVPALSGEHMPLAVRFEAATPAHYQHAVAGLIDRDAAHSLPVHPTQLYEIAALLMLILVIRSWRRRRKELPPGSTALQVLGAYAVIRFLLEFLRADSGLVLGPLTMTQLLCLATGVSCGLVLMLRSTPQDSTQSVGSTHMSAAGSSNPQFPNNSQD